MRITNPMQARSDASQLADARVIAELYFRAFSRRGRRCFEDARAAAPIVEARIVGLVVLAPVSTCATALGRSMDYLRDAWEH